MNPLVLGFLLVVTGVSLNQQLDQPSNFPQNTTKSISETMATSSYPNSSSSQSQDNRRYNFLQSERASRKVSSCCSTNDSSWTVFTNSSELIQIKTGASTISNNLVNSHIPLDSSHVTVMSQIQVSQTSDRKFHGSSLQQIAFKVSWSQEQVPIECTICHDTSSTTQWHEQKEDETKITLFTEDVHIFFPSWQIASATWRHLLYTRDSMTEVLMTSEALDVHLFQTGIDSTSSSIANFIPVSTLTTAPEADFESSDFIETDFSFIGLPTVQKQVASVQGTITSGPWSNTANCSSIPLPSDTSSIVATSLSDTPMVRSTSKGLEATQVTWSTLTIDTETLSFPASETMITTSPSENLEPSETSLLTVTHLNFQPLATSVDPRTTSTLKPAMSSFRTTSSSGTTVIVATPAATTLAVETPSYHPSYTLAAIITTSVATSAAPIAQATKPLTTSTTTSTTASAEPLKLGDNCSPSPDRCSHHIEGGQCVNHSCQCVWYKYRKSQACVSYSLENNSLQVYNSSQHSIALHWQAIELPGVSSVVYSVSWQSVTRLGQTRLAREKKTVTRTSVLLQKLTAGTEYDIWITAHLSTTRNKTHDLPLNFASLRTWTAPPEAGQLDRVTLNPAGRSAILIFKSPEGHFDECKASILEARTNTKRVPQQISHLTFNCTHLSVPAFQVGISYTVQVWVTCQNRSGDMSSQDVLIEYADPGDVHHFRVSNITAQSVDVVWEPPASSIGQVLGYEVRVYSHRKCTGHYRLQLSLARAATGSHQEHSPDGEKCQTVVRQILERSADDLFHFKISSLQPCHNYNLTVNAWNPRYKGRLASITFDTLAQIPDPPQNVKAIAVSSNQIWLTWEAPNRYSCPIDYIVYVYQLLTNGQGQVVNTTTLAGHNWTSLRIWNLSHDISYNISIASKSGAGKSKPVTIGPIRTKNTAPLRLQCHYPRPGTIVLTWEAPGQTTYHVLVKESITLHSLEQGFQWLDMSNVTVAGDSHRLTTGQAMPTSVTVNNLKHFWWYSFTLWTSSPEGQSQLVSTEPCRTLSTVPGQVRDVQVVSVSASVANISWTCPADRDKHGVIIRFLVTQRAKRVTREDLSLENVGNHTYILASSTPACLSRYGLEVKVVPQVIYTFQIQAEAKDVNELGDSVHQTFEAPAYPPPSINSLPSLMLANEQTTPSETSFTSRICVQCLMDSSCGEILTFGVLVCQDGFCDQNLDVLDHRMETVSTWADAKSKQFETAYRVTNHSWEQEVKTRIHAGVFDDVLLEVGSDMSCTERLTSDYCNGPLLPGKAFRIKLFTCTNTGCSISSTSPMFITAEPSSPASSDAIVIGGAAAGVSVAALVLIVVLVLRMKLRTCKKEAPTKGSHELSRVTALADLELTTGHQSRAILIADFSEVLQKLQAQDNALLNQEYSELEKATLVHTMEVGSELAHRQDNRWTNIIPYDSSRVKLTMVPGDAVCDKDYINANYITGVNSSHEYIATQGPLPRTIPDFWRMVWEQSTSAIVQLSDFEELDKRTRMLREKVARYFPDDADSKAYQFGHILVTQTCKNARAKWDIHTLKLTHVHERQNRFVRHFLFKRWSDHEADIEPADLVEFVKVVRKLTSTHPNGPLVIHCSAGVGRTGTYIAVDYFDQYISAISQELAVRPAGKGLGKWSVDIFGRVLSMRDKRRFMVQTKAQYYFIYRAVQELLRQAMSTQPEDVGVLQSAGAVEMPVYDDVEQLKGQLGSEKKL